MVDNNERDYTFMLEKINKPEINVLAGVITAIAGVVTAIATVAIALATFWIFYQSEEPTERIIIEVLPQEKNEHFLLKNIPSKKIEYLVEKVVMGIEGVKAQNSYFEYDNLAKNISLSDKFDKTYTPPACVVLKEAVENHGASTFSSKHSWRFFFYLEKWLAEKEKWWYDEKNFCQVYDNKMSSISCLFRTAGYGFIRLIQPFVIFVVCYVVGILVLVMLIYQGLGGKSGGDSQQKSPLH